MKIRFLRIKPQKKSIETLRKAVWERGVPKKFNFILLKIIFFCMYCIVLMR